MDVAAMSIAMSGAKVKQEVGVSVLKMAMDSAKGESADIAKMMEVKSNIQRSVMPHLGGNVDIRG